jgi:hypothetical protein
MMTRFFRTTIAMLFVASMLTGSAYAFDEDGFRSGMTLDEVKAKLPKGIRLEGKPVRFKGGATLYYVDGYYREDHLKLFHFTFCDDSLIAVTKIGANAQEFGRMMKRLIERYEQPSTIEASEDIAENDATVFVKWMRFPDTIQLVLVSRPSKSKKGRPVELGWVTFSVSTDAAACGYHHETPETMKLRPVPFGDLSLNN